MVTTKLTPLHELSNCVGSALDIIVLTKKRTTQEESHSGGTAVEVYTTVTLMSTLMSQR